jgi:hypothetical protein
MNPQLLLLRENGRRIKMITSINSIETGLAEIKNDLLRIEF